MKKLISMTDFVLKQSKIVKCEASEMSWLWDHVYQLESIYKYAEFLSQKLEIWQFVPCKLVEGVWVVLEEPKKNTTKDYNFTLSHEEAVKILEYQEAKGRVLFDGFDNFKFFEKHITFNISKKELITYCYDSYEFKNPMDVFKNTMSTIEDLVKYNLELTPTAQKQIGF